MTFCVFLKQVEHDVTNRYYVQRTSLKIIVFRFFEKRNQDGDRSRSSVF